MKSAEPRYQGVSSADSFDDWDGGKGDGRGERGGTKERHKMQDSERQDLGKTDRDKHRREQEDGRQRQGRGRSHSLTAGSDSMDGIDEQQANTQQDPQKQ